ncbi:lipoprotein signal peptidase [Xylanibacillus composti]|uniref:Lipoprotein signal peptidase n=1 Tax=Xylanibacillus composti TaxID=1572762 RepID=A0A8J4H3K3_9BACL|nr:signal peptidase II [Xylanibacillus composti]MDT9724347.1 lipoprotein signal peptidase [Xylanibacillus composti]GIQ67938.1 lipoprotein signal peptidase [Xylanibacillus composti]
MKKWVWIIAAFIFAIDQLTKWIIKETMVIGERISVIGDFFSLTSHRNRGAAFGILQDQRWFFLIATVIIVAGVIWYMLKSVSQGKRLLPIALSLVLGGALGNFIDRLLAGEVVDFFQFRFMFDLLGKAVDYTYPIFNVADAAIVVGVALIFVDAILEWRNEGKELKHDG